MRLSLPLVCAITLSSATLPALAETAPVRGAVKGTATVGKGVVKGAGQAGVGVARSTRTVVRRTDRGFLCIVPWATGVRTAAESTVTARL